MTSEFLIMSNEQEKRKIPTQDILYVIISDYLSTFKLKNNQSFTCSKSLSEIADILPDNFLQVNRSCVVNMNEVYAFRRQSRIIQLSDSSELTVSFRRIKIFYDTFANQDIAFTGRSNTFKKF